MASFSRLPAEMIEKIVDALADDSHDSDHQSLKSCALVCHSFLSPCRKHIFSSITVNAREKRNLQPTSPNTQQLHSLLAHSPEIRNYIREIRYNMEIRLAPKYIKAIEQPNNSLLGTLQLTSLHIIYSSRTFGDYWFRWNPLTSQQSLQPLLHIPTLTHLRLCGILDFPLIELLSCEGLKGLKIESLTFQDSTKLKTPSAPIRITSFNAAARTSGALARLLALKGTSGIHLVDFSGVQKLFLTSWGTKDVRNLQELFSRCKGLTDVTVINESPMLNLSEFGDTIKPSLSTIQNLRFDLSVVDIFASGVVDPFPGLTQALEEISNKNIIETIDIQVLVSQAGCSQRDKWGQLDRVLTSTPSAWPKLKAVSLSIKVTKLFNSDDDELERAAEQLLVAQFRGLSTNESILFAFKLIHPVE